jgi:hypothetical protein
MPNELDIGLGNISQDALDALFNATPDATVTADALSTGKVNADTGLPQLETEDLEKLENPKVEEEKKVEEKEPEVKLEEEKKEEEKKEELSPEEVAAHKEVLKSTVDFLVAKGLWKDFDGREELEMTDEIYAELAEAQLQAAVEEKYSLQKKAAGDYGEAIMDFIEKGGDPDLLIDLFKESKAVQQFDISTEDSQKELITKYYKETLGWKSDKVKKYIDGIALEEGELEKEASEIKGKYEEGYKQQINQLRQQQDAFEREQQQRRQVFQNNITKVIEDNKEYDDSRKLLLKNSLFKYKKLEDGSLVNEFYLKFAEWQNDPKKYVELAEFVLDYENFMKRKDIAAQNKAVDKSFKFIKGNAAVSKKTGSSHIEPKKEETTFSFAFKK